MRVLVKHVTDPRFGEMVCDVAGLVIRKSCTQKCINSSNSRHTEMYTPILGQSPLIDTLFLRLRKKVIAELRFQKELRRTKGALDMVFSAVASASVTL